MEAVKSSVVLIKNKLLQLENSVQHCVFFERDDANKLREIIHQVINLIHEHFESGGNSAVPTEVLLQLRSAESQLDAIRSEYSNINDWKHNIKTFGKAKADILYPINLLLATLRFGNHTSLSYDSI